MNYTVATILERSDETWLISIDPNLIPVPDSCSIITYGELMVDFGGVFCMYDHAFDGDNDYCLDDLIIQDFTMNIHEPDYITKHGTIQVKAKKCCVENGQSL